MTLHAHTPGLGRRISRQARRLIQGGRARTPAVRGCRASAFPSRPTPQAPNPGAPLRETGRPNRATAENSLHDRVMTPRLTPSRQGPDSWSDKLLTDHWTGVVTERLAVPLQGSDTGERQNGSAAVRSVGAVTAPSSRQPAHVSCFRGSQTRTVPRLQAQCSNPGDQGATYLGR